jgi:hypothetical protein
MDLTLDVSRACDALMMVAFDQGCSCEPLVVDACVQHVYYMCYLRAVSNFEDKQTLTKIC